MRPDQVMGAHIARTRPGVTSNACAPAFAPFGRSAKTAGSAPVIHTCDPSAASASNKAARRRGRDGRRFRREAPAGRSAHGGDQPCMRQHEPDEERLLLAGGGLGCRHVLRAVAHGEVRRLRADQRAARGAVARTALAQPGPVEILDVDGRAMGQLGFQRAFEREARPGEGRGIVPPCRDEGREAFDGFAPGGGHGHAGFGDLALYGVQPGGVGPLVLQQPVPGAQGAFQRIDPAAMLGVHGQDEPVEKATAISGRTEKQAVERRREPDHAHIFGEGSGEETGARSMRQRRTRPPSVSPRSEPVPSWTSVSPMRSATEIAKVPGPPWRGMADSSARRRPRPAVKSDNASRMFVLPAPFSPVSATSRPSTARSSAS